MTSIILHANGAQALPHPLASSSVGLDLHEFHRFPKLPCELRTKVWEAALPGPHILRLTAAKCFAKENTRAKTSQNKYVVTTTYTFRLAFQTTDPVLGLFQACVESRQVAIRAFPIRLCSSDATKEIRFGPLDAINISNLVEFLKGLRKASRNDINVPSAISGIEAMAWVETNDISFYPFLDTSRRFRFPRPRTLYGDNTTDPFHELPGLKQLIFVCDDADATRNGNFSGFESNDFAKKDMDTTQLAMYEHALQTKIFIENASRQGVAQHKWKVVPEVKVVARDWPVKKEGLTEVGKTS